MVMDTLALAVSASANYFLRHKEAQRMMLPLVAFPICGLLDLFCIYHELKAVQLRSLNRERAEMVAQHWLEQGKVRAWDVRSRLSSSPAGLQGLQHA
jgi:glutamate N-acetyltransferase/amino-acid N-acetyltransferase